MVAKLEVSSRLPQDTMSQADIDTVAAFREAIASFKRKEWWIDRDTLTIVRVTQTRITIPSEAA